MIVNKFTNSDNNIHLNAILKHIIDKVQQQDLYNIVLGRHTIEGFSADDAFFVVMEYQTTPTSEHGPEFHQEYIDIQFIMSGSERCGWGIITDEERAVLATKYHYDRERDICFISDNNISLSYFNLNTDEYYIFTPNTLHMPNLSVDTPTQVRKVVIKIKLHLLE